METSSQTSPFAPDNRGVLVTGQGNVVNVGPTPVDYFNAGLNHIRLRMYAQATEDFRQAGVRDHANPDVYYFSAIAALEGRTAFLASLASVREAERLLHAALSLRERGVFYLFLAYLAHDYYERKSLNPPTSSQSWLYRAQQCGVTADEFNGLFGLLSVTSPWSVIT